MLDWLIASLPFSKYGGYILAAYSIGFISILLLGVQFIRGKKSAINQLKLKYRRDD